MKSWVKDVTPDSVAAANITTTQLERLEALETKNELLKTDIGNFGSPSATPGQSVNYTRQQALLNNTTIPPTPSVLQQKLDIREQMQQLREQFLSL